MDEQRLKRMALVLERGSLDADLVAVHGDALPTFAVFVFLIVVCTLNVKPELLDSKNPHPPYIEISAFELATRSNGGMTTGR